MGRIAVPSSSAHSSRTLTSTERAVSQVKMLYPKAIHATMGVTLDQQSSQFQQTVAALPPRLVTDIEQLLCESATSLAIDMDAADHKATVLHTDKAGSLKAMEVTWGDAETTTTPTPSTTSNKPPAAISRPPPPPPRPPPPRPPRPSADQPAPPVATTSSFSFANGCSVVTALSGKPLSQQPTSFTDTVSALPPQVQTRVTELLTEAKNEVTVEMRASEGTASVISKNGQQVSTLKASWDPGAWNPANWDPSQDTTPSPNSHPAPAQQMTSSLGGTVVFSTPGKPVSQQTKAFQGAVESLPEQVHDRITDLLKDAQNEVSVDINADEGKAHVICKNGLRTSTLKASWNVIMKPYSESNPTTQKAATSGGVRVQPNDTDAVSSTATALASIKVVANEDGNSTSSELRANPKFGLRKV